ncbi:MAG: hypothetical protein ABI417_06425 [Coleofasciculaceae cyanobacterium]
MTKDNQTRKKPGEQALLASLTIEVDSVFFSLRKADQVIRRELSLLNQKTFNPFKKASINPINLEKLSTVFNKIPLQQLLVDEYITYMLKNEKSSIFKLIEEYNAYLDKRLIEQYDKTILEEIDEKLTYYIRHLGAMIYHLNIHLNLLNVLLKNTSRGVDSKQLASEASKEIVMNYMVKKWGEQQGDVKLLEITIDEPYAIVTWALENFGGDAILFQDEGYWQLMSISANRFTLDDFEKADVPLEIAQRMIELHHQKLGY